MTTLTKINYMIKIIWYNKKMKPIHITFGILAMLFLIVTTNAITYEGLFRLFTSISPNLILLILSLFSIGFLVAVIIGMKHSNPLIRFFYTVTSAWLGFFVYIFLASLTYFILYIFFDKNFIILGEILFVLAILFGIYGLINARELFIKKVNIKIPELPKEWLDRKAVWVSDIHIGLIYRKKHIEKIVKKINNLKPDIVFIGGDLFDGISVPSVINFADPLSGITAPLGVYFVSGNHEHYGNMNEFNKKIESLGIKILKNEMLTIDNLQIIGTEYSHFGKKEAFRKTLSEMNIDKNKISILLKHEPNDLKIAEEAGINLQISGHVHKGQQWPFNYYAKLFYGRFTYGHKQHGKMQVYVSSGAGTWGPSVRVGSKSEIVEITFNK